jgi:hypothetical protein
VRHALAPEQWQVGYSGIREYQCFESRWILHGKRLSDHPA